MGLGWRAYGWSFNCCRVRCIPVVGDHVKISVAENRGLVHYSSWAQLQKSVSCISGLDCISCKSPYSRSLIVVLKRKKTTRSGIYQSWVRVGNSIFRSLKKIDRDRIALVNLLKRSTVIESILFTIESIFDKKKQWFAQFFTLLRPKQTSFLMQIKMIIHLYKKSKDFVNSFFFWSNDPKNWKFLNF